MKVAVVTESFLPQVNGVTNSVLRILETLKSAGHDALVIAPEGEETPSEFLGFRVKTIPSIPIQSILPIGLPVALPTRKLEYLFDGYAPDLIHLASPFALGSYSAKLGKKMGIATLSVYQTDLAGFASHYGLNVAHSSLRKMVGRIHSNTDRTLAPSRWACDELKAQGVENVYLWRRGVKTHLFRPDAKNSDLYKKLSANGRKLVVGYVGRLANEKRVYDLKYLARDSNIQILITGDGPAREKLEKLMPTAIFTGFKSGEELAEIYASLDLFVHPGPNETFCQSVQEALASGTPCIVPPTGGPSDLVTHGFTGYVINTHRPDELEAAVLHYRLRSDREEMSINSRISVESRTWEKVNAQLMNHYSELTTKKIEGIVA